MRLDEIEEKIVELCRERDKLLTDMGVEEPYLVYDASTKALNENTWVLTPENDMSKIRSIIRFYKDDVSKRVLTNWLLEYKDYSCKDYCPNTGTPVCCFYCDRRSDCEYQLVRCPYVGKDFKEVNCDKFAGFTGRKEKREI